MILVCRIRGDFDVPDYASLEQLVSDYVQANEEDRPIPTEIVTALLEPEFRGRFNAESHLVAKEGCRLITGIGVHNVFAEELLRLLAVAGKAK